MRKSDSETCREFLQKPTRYDLGLCLAAVVEMSALAKQAVSVILAQDSYEGYKILPFVTFGVFFLGLQWILHSACATMKNYRHHEYHCRLRITQSNSKPPSSTRYRCMAAAVTILTSYYFFLILAIMASRKSLIWESPVESLGEIMSTSKVIGAVAYYIRSDLRDSALLNRTPGILFGQLFCIYDVSSFGRVLKIDRLALHYIFLGASGALEQ